jgi:hypothetical protein
MRSCHDKLLPLSCSPTAWNTGCKQQGQRVFGAPPAISHFAEQYGPDPQTSPLYNSRLKRGERGCELDVGLWEWLRVKEKPHEEDQRAFGFKLRRCYDGAYEKREDVRAYTWMWAVRASRGKGVCGMKNPQIRPMTTKHIPCLMSDSPKAS